MSLRDRLAEWPLLPTTIQGVSFILPALPALTFIILMFGFVLTPRSVNFGVFLAGLLGSIVLGMVFLYNASSLLARKLASLFIPPGKQLFPSYKLFVAWWRNLPHPDANTRKLARMVELLQSKDPEELGLGIAQARTLRHWRSWIQKGAPFHWSDETGSGQIKQTVAMLRAGALAPRFSEKFIPITFLAWQRYGSKAIERELLELLLDIGADINDVDPSGRSLLDQMIRFCQEGSSGATFVAEDFDYLIDRGAIPTRKTVEALKKIEDDQALMRAQRIEAQWNREKLTLLVEQQGVVRDSGQARAM